MPQDSETPEARSARQEAATRRARLLADPEAAAEAEAKAQEHADQQDNPHLPPEYIEALTEQPLVPTEAYVVGMDVVEGGVAVTILVPWPSVTFKGGLGGEADPS